MQSACKAARNGNRNDFKPLTSRLFNFSIEHRQIFGAVCGIDQLVQGILNPLNEDSEVRREGNFPRFMNYYEFIIIY